MRASFRLLCMVGDCNITTMDNTEFRRLRGSDTWHFSEQCSNWPTAGYRAYKGDGEEPGDGEFCNECISKAGKSKPKKAKKKAAKPKASTKVAAKASPKKKAKKSK